MEGQTSQRRCISFHFIEAYYYTAIFFFVLVIINSCSTILDFLFSFHKTKASSYSIFTIKTLQDYISQSISPKKLFVQKMCPLRSISLFQLRVFAKNIHFLFSLRTAFSFNLLSIVFIIARRLYPTFNIIDRLLFFLLKNLHHIQSLI